MHDIAAQVDELLVATGFRKDRRGVTASGSVMTRPAAEWRRTIEAWFDEPTEAKLMATCILLDGRTIRGPSDAFGVFSAIRGARYRDRMVRLLLRVALVDRPPTGFLRDLVVEHSGEHQGRLNIKRGGLMPIIGVARYAGLVAECRSTSTVARLEAAGAAGVLVESDAATLGEAYRLMVALRMDHQVRQLQAGEDPDDYLDPKELDSLTRRYLRDAFRLVTTTQKKLATELDWT
jgi:CBS domain-containing protein